MKTTFTIEDIKKSPCWMLNQHLEEKTVKVKKSKYGNNKKEVDGITFDSEKEANRYKDLKILLKAGEIGLLELQVPFELNPGGTYSLKYYADFIYLDSRTGEKVVEDVKGFRNKTYSQKRKLMKKVHEIDIKET